MLKNSLVSLLLGMLFVWGTLTSCQMTSASQVINESSSPTSFPDPSVSAEETPFSITQQVKPEQTPELLPKVNITEGISPSIMDKSTTTPTPQGLEDEIVLPWAELDNTQLWIKFQDKYFVATTNSEESFTIDLPPKTCQFKPLPNFMDVICLKDNSVSLFDLESREERTLSIQGVNRVHVTSNGRYLYYTRENTAGKITVFRFDIQTSLEEILIPEMTDECISCPLSSNGFHYVVAIDNQLIDLVQGTVLEKTPPEILLTYLQAWSPVDNQLAFAATDILSGFELRVNYLYLADFTTNEVQLLSKTDFSFDEGGGWPIWSPNGKFIARHTEKTICILDIETKDENCQGLQNKFPVIHFLKAITWSPNSQFITICGSTSDNNYILLIYSMNTGDIKLLKESNENICVTFWN